jgi:hypothetical protein
MAKLVHVDIAYNKHDILEITIALQIYQSHQEGCHHFCPVGRLHMHSRPHHRAS